MVFSHARQLWVSNPSNLVDYKVNGGNKRNDRLVRGFAQFLEKSRYKRPLLVLLEYGPDVALTKLLIDELDISAYVAWLPKMNRKKIMPCLRQANIVVDQLRENICGVGGVGYEALSCGLPLVTYTNQALLDRKSYLYNAPIIDALTASDVCNVFLDYECDANKYKVIGDESKVWFNNTLGAGLAKKYIEILQENLKLTCRY